MVKFVYRHGDYRYKSPFTNEEILFIGTNATEITDKRDADLFRKCNAFIEIDAPAPTRKKEIPKKQEKRLTIKEKKEIAK